HTSEFRASGQSEGLPFLSECFDGLLESQEHRVNYLPNRTVPQSFSRLILLRTLARCFLLKEPTTQGLPEHAEDVGVRAPLHEYLEPIGKLFPQNRGRFPSPRFTA